MPLPTTTMLPMDIPTRILSLDLPSTRISDHLLHIFLSITMAPMPPNSIPPMCNQSPPLPPMSNLQSQQQQTMFNNQSQQQPTFNLQSKQQLKFLWLRLTIVNLSRLPMLNQVELLIQDNWRRIRNVYVVDVVGSLLLWLDWHYSLLHYFGD